VCAGLLDEVVQVTGADAIAHAKDMATREVSSLSPVMQKDLRSS
jgi:hypothetical protein